VIVCCGPGRGKTTTAARSAWPPRARDAGAGAHHRPASASPGHGPLAAHARARVGLEGAAARGGVTPRARRVMLNPTWCSRAWCGAWPRPRAGQRSSTAASSSPLEGWWRGCRNTPLPRRSTSCRRAQVRPGVLDTAAARNALDFLGPGKLSRFLDERILSRSCEQDPRHLKKAPTDWQRLQKGLGKEFFQRVRSSLGAVGGSWPQARPARRRGRCSLEGRSFLSVTARPGPAADARTLPIASRMGLPSPGSSESAAGCATDGFSRSRLAHLRPDRPFARAWRSSRCWRSSS